MITDDERRQLRDYFSTQPQVVAVYLYGSVARGTANKLSDIDLAVMLEQFDDHTSQFQLQAIGKMMTIFKTDDVDVQILSPQTAPAIALQMLKGKVIYTGQPAKKIAVEAQILSRYQDFEPFIRLDISQMHKRLEEGTYGSG